jgi:hypothetical protein
VATSKAAKAAQGKSTEPDAPAPLEPPFWVALVPLPVGTEMGGEAMHARAFNPGDRVPPDHVERFGWQQYVEAPPGDWAQPAAPPPDDSDQAGTAAPDKE